MVFSAYFQISHEFFVKNRLKPIFALATIEQIVYNSKTVRFLIVIIKSVSNIQREEMITNECIQQEKTAQCRKAPSDD